MAHIYVTGTQTHTTHIKSVCIRNVDKQRDRRVLYVHTQICEQINVCVLMKSSLIKG